MTSQIIPTMRYRDANGMLAWLIDAFGFDKHQVYEDGDGNVVHAELTMGKSMIMLAPARDDEFGKLMQTAADLGGVSQSAYIIVGDVDAVCERARAVGAEVLMGPRDEDYGGRGFVCRDPEGQLWSFGSYDPWAAGA